VASPPPEKTDHRKLAVALLGVGAVAGIAWLGFHEMEPEHRRFHRNFAYEAGGQAGPSHAGLTTALGVAAALSAGAGIGLLLWHPSPAAPSLSMGVAPAGVVLSGTLP
jgi:hypothetical protein